MKYYACTVIVEVPEERYKDWSEQADEIFHGVGFLHNPEDGVYLVEYHETTKIALELNKHRIFTEEGGI